MKSPIAVPPDCENDSDDAVVFQPRREPFHLRRFPASFRAFKGNERHSKIFRQSATIVERLSSIKADIYWDLLLASPVIGRRSVQSKKIKLIGSLSGSTKARPTGHAPFSLVR